MLFYNINPKFFLKTCIECEVVLTFDEFIQYQGVKFYLVTIFEIWSARINQIQNNSDMPDWEKILSHDYIDQMKNYKYPIFFDASGECMEKEIWDSLIQMCEYVGIEKNNVYVALANSQSVKLSLKAYPYIKDFKLFSIERFVFDAVEVKSALGDNIYKFKFENNKRFLFINRKYSPDRAYLYFKLRQYEILNNIHHTFRLESIYTDKIINLNTVLEDIKKNYNDTELVKYIENNSEEINKTLPVEIKSELSTIYNANYRTSCLYSFWNLAVHNSTSLNIIAETFSINKKIPADDIHYKTIFFITEKTYRTILMKQPFIMFSNPYALKYLRESGYRTFSPFINESYDEVENLEERQQLIIKEVKRINELSDDNFQELMSQCKPIINYNHDLMMNRLTDKYHNTVGIDESIKPFIKNAGSSSSSIIAKRYNKFKI